MGPTQKVEQRTEFILGPEEFSIARKSPYHDVPLLPATAENLKEFGTLVDDFDTAVVEKLVWPKTSGWRKVATGSGNLHPVVEGDYIVTWKGDFVYGDNMAVGGLVKGFVTGIGGEEGLRDFVFTRDPNYHPDGSQVFFSKFRHPFVLLMAPPVGDDVKLEDFKAFWFDGFKGFNIAPFVWHQVPFSLDDQAVFLNKQSSVFASVLVDTVLEFGKFLRVPLKMQ